MLEGIILREYTIYKATNKINGKSYIGQTIDFEHRKHTHIHRRDGYCDPNSIFHMALDKYGEENFEWEELMKVPSKEFANAMEKTMIQKYGTYKPNGYNLTKGGDGGSMWNAMPVVCLALDGEFVKRYDSASEAEKDGFYYQGILRVCRGELRKTKGHIFMFESDYKNHGARSYIETPNLSKKSKEVYQCDLDGNFIETFPSVREAEKVTGIGHSHIHGCLNGTYKTAGGYIFVYPKDFPIKDIESHKKKVKGHKVAQVDKNTGEIIAVYDRMTDAAKVVGGTHKGIHKVIDKPTRTAYGFKWISQ